MNLSSLIEILINHFQVIYPNVSFDSAKFPFDNSLLFPHLSSEEFNNYVIELLKDGDGNPLDQIYKVNSSTTLAVYYFTLLKKVLDREIKYFAFECKVGVPLDEDKLKNRKINPINKPKSANLDVVVGIDKTIWFIESKFLEPYYMSAKKLSDSYLDPYYYRESDSGDIWTRYAKIINKLIDNKNPLYYDIPQMFKHLLSIYSNRNDWYDKSYSDIVLTSIGWKMSDKFKNKIESKRSLSFIKKRDEKLCIQINDGVKLLNDIILELEWVNCKVEYIHYNDAEILDKIKSNLYSVDFVKRYLIANDFVK